MSKTLVVQYRVHEDAADQNVRLVGEVFTALARTAPDGFRYSTYRLADGVSFVHLACFVDGQNPLATLAEFGEFQRELPKRCLEQPVASAATVVGSYGWPT
jgi:hypothetical protein